MSTTFPGDFQTYIEPYKERNVEDGYPQLNSVPLCIEIAEKHEPLLATKLRIASEQLIITKFNEPIKWFEFLQSWAAVCRMVRRLGKLKEKRRRW